MKIRYNNSIVAFLDVLGFTEIVNNSNHRLIEIYFDYVSQSLDSITTLKGLNIFCISDSILIYGEESIENLEKIIDIVKYIQVQLLSKKILLRGAISNGALFVDKNENIIVGPGLIKAYHLESLANSPRVIVDRGLIKTLSFTNTESFKSQINKTLSLNGMHESISVDEDNFIFVNYASYLCSRRQHYTTKQLIHIVHDLIQSNFLNNKHLDKYDWLRGKVIIELEKKLSHATKHNATLSKSAARTQNNLFLRMIPIWLDRFKEI